MCGIAGIISLNQIPIDYNEIVSMTDKIRHRGPDGEGFLITRKPEFLNKLKTTRPEANLIYKEHRQEFAFGHRRLSILDLNANAFQPMTEFYKRYWIVYNGEIYNHAALRKELEVRGYKFETDHADTEVILNAYDCWGPGCLDKFNGMWAFCIWDSHANSFFIARDKIGKKPFYYTIQENKFYFASEVKAFISNSHIPKTLNEKAVYDYLTYAMVPSPETMFKGVYKLPAAHYILFKPGEEIKTRQYWSPLNPAPYMNEPEEEIIKEIREKIDESSRLRMMADVDVGVLLSGGLDSSINLASLSKQSSKPVKTFSVGFENKNGYTNEFEYSRKIAAYFKADYHELILNETDFIDFLPNMIYFQDEPTSDPANIPIHFISKMAREKGVKVLIGGEGSDEIFIGYKLWDMARKFSRVMEGKPNLAKITGFLHALSPFKNKRAYYHGWYTKVAKDQPVFWSGTELRSEKEKTAILSRDFLEKIGDYNSFYPLQKLYSSFSANEALDNYSWMTSSDLLFRLPELLLARLDRMTMAASVEGRTPFLDTNLIEYVMKIPPHLKNKNNQEKYILKKTFEGILPNETIYRKKDSFTVPMKDLYKNKAYKEMCITSINKFNRETGIFSDNYLKQIKTITSENFWNLTNLALWHEKFK